MHGSTAEHQVDQGSLMEELGIEVNNLQVRVVKDTKGRPTESTNLGPQGLT